MLQISRRVPVAVALLAVLLVSGAVAARTKQLERRRCVHARAMTADVVPSPRAFSPFTLATVVLPALPSLSFSEPASADLDHYAHAPISAPITRPPPRPL
jgi:hypothetical protein